VEEADTSLGIAGWTFSEVALKAAGRVISRYKISKQHHKQRDSDTNDFSTMLT
jgi:hypothetical protein